MRRFIAVMVMISAPAWGGADEQIGKLIKEIQHLAVRKKPGSDDARAAWKKLVAIGPAALPALIDAMDTPDTVTANWFRTAFDRIVQNELKKNRGKNLDVGLLLAVVQDRTRQGRVRRLALEIVEELRPGTTKSFLSGWLDDPEFRYEAVENLVDQGKALQKEGHQEKANQAFQKAFAASRDVKQAMTIAQHLHQANIQVSLAEHFGFLTDWYLIGPFDGKMQTGFKNSYPPEQKVDLRAEWMGKGKRLKWVRYRAKEQFTGPPHRAVLVNLTDALGQSEDAVGYAYTRIRVPREMEVEFRGAADDNLTVWVNGQRVFGFEEYRNGVRVDRHRFRVRLRQGINEILVKVCQAPYEESSPEPNWEFLLRIVDLQGEGLRFESVPD
ncbi:MAG: hypothetical protein KatS3mg105_3532 [Gemmatales bacterium]|nr:MAG: hypothetical protein KatS3mg105_3532 [Gemmatales bacterium]